MRLLPLNHQLLSQIDFSSNQKAVCFKNKIDKIKQAIKLIEILLVEKKYRTAATVKIPKNKLKSEVRDIKKRNLIFTPVQWVKQTAELSHLDELASPNDSEAMCYGVVTKTSKMGELFKKASLRQQEDHDTIGKLLGYPKCCREFFIEMWSSGYIDPIWQQALNTGSPTVKEEFYNNKFVGYSVDIKGYPQCVTMHRYWGIRYSLHLPCSFTCRATYEIGKIWAKELDEIDKDISKAILEILSLPTTWSALRGAAVIYTPYSKGVAASVPCADLHTVHFTSMEL